MATVTVVGTVDAEVSISSIEPDPAKPGDTVIVSFRVENTGDMAHTFAIGAGIWNNSTKVATLKSLAREIEPGILNSYIASYIYDIPSNWAEGIYEVRVSAWADSIGGTLLDEDDEEFDIARTVTLTVSSTDGGHVAEPPGEGTFTYTRGQEVTLIPEPDPGYHFTNWSGNVWSEDNPLTLEMDMDYRITANFEADSQEPGAKIVDFLPPKGPVPDLRIVHTTVAVSNTGQSPRSFWVSLSFAHETATTSDADHGWLIPEPIPTEVIQPNGTATVEFDYMLTEGLSGQYYAAASVWDDYSIQTGAFGKELDTTLSNQLWKDSDTGAKSFFWLPWNAVCISDVMIDRVPAVTSRAAMQTGLWVGVSFEDEVAGRPYLGSCQYPRILVGITNNTAEEFHGMLTAHDSWLDPSGRLIKGTGILEPGESKEYVLVHDWALKTSNSASELGEICHATVRLAKGSVIAPELIDARDVALVVVNDSEDIANGPITNIVAPLPVNVGETSLFVELFESARLLLTFGTEQAPTPYMDYLQDLRHVEQAVLQSGYIRISDDGPVGDARMLSVKWANFNPLDYTAVQYDAARILVKLPSGVEVLDAGGGSVFTTDDNSVWIQWDVVRPDKRIAVGDYNYIYFSLAELEEDIVAEGEIMLLLGPFQGQPGEQCSVLSEFPLVYNWKFLSAGLGYWYPVARGDTRTQLAASE